MRVATDPIGFEVFRNALVAVADQMAVIIWRTSFSTIIRELLDYSTAIFDPSGRIVAQSCRSPIHLNAMSRSLRSIFAHSFPPETWRPGDIIIMNDPYLGGQHLPDVQTFMPVFVDGELVVICGALGHQLDIGGMRPGSYAADATEIYQEGLRITPLKIAESGQLNTRLFEFIGANIRQPDKTLGDLRAQMAALEIGGRSIVDLVKRYGLARFREYTAETLTMSERRMRAALQGIPDGTYHGEDFLDDDGAGSERVRVAVRVTVAAGEVTVDFEGTSRQRRSPINATISSTESATYWALIALVGSDIPANYGCYGPIHVVAPAGTVVNALPPAPVVGRMAIAHTITNALFAAFAQAIPDRVTAGYYGMSNVYVFASESGALDGWVLVDIEIGGWGARPTKDGLDVYCQGTHNFANTPIEMIETLYPLRYHRYEFVSDTGGPGRFRGGLGVARDVEFLGERGSFSSQFDKFKVAPFGLFGGGAGGVGQLSLESKGRVVPLPSKTVARALVMGDIVRMRTQGGGGYGDPASRDRRLVERDVLEGKVTAAAARRDYALSTDGE